MDPRDTARRYEDNRGQRETGFLERVKLEPRNNDKG